MSEQVREEVNEEIFEDFGEAVAVAWWLVYLLGGRVVFPRDVEFWNKNFPTDAVLVRRYENGESYLIAEHSRTGS